ncbi:MAG: ABC transporter permease [Pseudobdellovibrionaceae bacterium]
MFDLALKHLTSRKKQTFLIFLGIALGTMTFVFIAAIQLGFREYIVEQLVNNNGHIVISAREEIITEDSVEEYLGYNHLVHWVSPPSGKRNDDSIENPHALIQSLEREPEVFAYSPIYSTQTIATRGKSKLAVSLIGVQPENHIRVTDFVHYSSKDVWTQIPQGSRRLIVGTGALKKLSAQVGDTLFLSVGSAAALPFKIAGTFELGVQQVDDTTIFSHVIDVQQLGQASGKISSIAVRLTDPSIATVVADRLRLTASDKVQSWEQINANFFSLFKIQDLTRYFITAGILLVAAFGIYNVLSIVVTQKRREIAILRALGFPPKDILLLFLQQGIILGVAGAIAGLILGYIFCYALAQSDIEVMGRKGLTMSFSPTIYVQGLLMAIFSAIVASYLPARMASKLSPIDIIRMDS